MNEISKMNEKEEIASLYFHISNGGVSFSVKDTVSGPAICIDGGSFGNTMLGMKLFVSRKSLRTLGNMFIKASEYEGYGEEYCCSAKANNPSLSQYMGEEWDFYNGQKPIREEKCECGDACGDACKCEGGCSEKSTFKISIEELPEDDK